MKRDLFAMGLHLLAGIAVGYISLLLGMPLYSVVLAIITGYALKMASAKLFPGTDQGWWFANGGLIYIFTWLVTWILLFNL
ncbi:MAG: hypothetical protein QXD77_01470 [Candidatus Aenigmatarchaeota archaeon]